MLWGDEVSLFPLTVPGRTPDLVSCIGRVLGCDVLPTGPQSPAVPETSKHPRGLGE